MKNTNFNLHVWYMRINLNDDIHNKLQHNIFKKVEFVILNNNDIWDELNSIQSQIRKKINKNEI